MRKQEDQIYELQDYLTEYQQLLCDARSENARLKRQLVQGQFREELPSPDSEQPATQPTPSAAPPTAPPGTSAPSAEPGVTPPEVPPLDLSKPAVPPLKDQSSLEIAHPDKEIQPTTVAVEVVRQPPTAVALRGEVRLDGATSGPRVLVEVEPTNDEGAPTDFQGNLSVLVLDPAARAKEQQLARWDFAADELPPMAKSAGHATVFEFPLQLPADAPTNRPLELWVRLVPEDGQKLLGRTTLDLGRPGRFASASATQTAIPKDKPVKAAVAELPVDPGHYPARSRNHRRDIHVEQSGWRTAKPGEVTTPPMAAAKSTEWRLASRPVPDVESAPRVEDDRYGASGTHETPAAPDWSPNRAGEASPVRPQQPAWSPTR